MENISVDEFYKRVQNLNNNDELILDVRTREEFEEGHIKGARNVPHEEVGTIADELKQYRKVYVHCKMGGRAKIASQELQSRGLDNIICVGDGGMQRWMEMGWPMEK